MQKSVKQYRQMVLQTLRCGFMTKLRLRRELDAMLRKFERDMPCPDWRELTEAFGPPEEMVGTLMAGVSVAEQMRWLRLRPLARVSTGIVMAVILLFAMYVFCLKENSVYIYKIDGAGTEVVSSVVDTTLGS